MKVIYWPENEGKLPAQSVATIGAFDGVHTGHRRVLFELVREAEEKETESVAITFDRLPGNAVGSGDLRPLTSLSHKLKLFAKLGIQTTVVIRFTPEVAEITARDFAEKVFRDGLAVRKLILGFDGRFGKDGRGGAELCREMGIPIRRIAPVGIEGEIVSSTAIRNAIEDGDLMKAAKLLGRPYSITGKVIHGDSFGTDIGYPTANLDTDNELLPKEGVYAARVHIDDHIYDSAVSIGRRETVHGPGDNRLVAEAYLLDEDQNLYGKEMEVQFLSYIREQKNFAKVEGLKVQIARDVEKVKQVLSGKPSAPPGYRD